MSKSKSYAEKLRDPRWQKKRLEILERDGWTCCFCGENDKTLHVHHRYYLAGIEPWDYESDSLITYCDECHACDVVTDIRKDMVRSCGCVPVALEWQLRYVLVTLCDPAISIEDKTRVLKRADRELRKASEAAYSAIAGVSGDG